MLNGFHNSKHETFHRYTLAQGKNYAKKFWSSISGTIKFGAKILSKNFKCSESQENPKKKITYCKFE